MRGGTASFSYVYNADDQRIRQSISDPGMAYRPAAALSLAYGRNALNQYTGLSGSQSVSFIYDGNGNLSGDGVTK